MSRVYAALAFVSWLALLWPFPVEVFLASCLACLCLPLYRHLQKSMERRLAVTCMALILTLSIVLPLTIIALLVTPQAVNGLKMLDNLQRSGWFQGAEAQGLLESVDAWLRLFPGMEKGVRELAGEAASMAGATLRALLTQGLGLAGSTLGLVVRLLVLIVLTMVAILYAPSFYRFALILTRFSSAVLDRFVRAIRQATRSVLVGVVFVAMIQGVLCGVGFQVAGLRAPAFWGLVAALVAPIPIVGTSLVWIPACIYLWFGVSKAAAVGLMLWCCLAVVGADNFLRPFFLRGGLNAPFSVVLIAILCGIIAFGAVGVVAGPVMAAFALQAGREAERSRYADRPSSLSGYNGPGGTHGLGGPSGPNGYGKAEKDDSSPW